MSKRECFDCIDCCASCSDFDSFVATTEDLQQLILVRKKLIAARYSGDDGFLGRLADWLVERVGSMTFFFSCLVASVLFVVVPSFNSIFQEISSVVQLVTIPLLLVAGNRVDLQRQFKSEREFRMLLVSDRIDELSEAVEDSE